MSVGKKTCLVIGLSGAAAVALAAGGLLVLEMNRDMTRAATDLWAPISIVAAAVAAGAGLAAFLLWRLLLKPLDALSRWAVLVQRAENAPAMPPPATRRLARHADTVVGLGEALQASRDSLGEAAAQAAARAENDKRRLEAILRDLSEAVILCNREHRVSLYNERAARLFGGPERIGLGRSVFDVVASPGLAGAFDRIVRSPAAGARAPIPVAVGPHDGTAEFDGHLGPIVEADGRLSGFVLSIVGPPPSSEHVVGPPPSPMVVGGTSIPPRPEFYDFALLERSAATTAPIDARALLELDYVVFDTETTGLRPEEDELVAIAGVRVVNGRIRHSEIFERLIDPGRPIPPSSTRIHGITNLMIKGKPPARIVLPQFHRFAKDAVLVAHNAAFDLAFIARREAESGVTFGNPVLDTLLLSRFLDPGESDHSLDALTARFGIAIGGRHTARGDAEATAAVFVRLLDLLAQRGVTTFEAARRACGGARALRPRALDI